MKELKVLYIVNHAVPYGANVALLNVLDGICNKGVIPMVVTGDIGALCDELDKRKIPHTIINHYFAIYPFVKGIRDLIAFPLLTMRMLFVNFFAEMKLKRIVKRFRPDIIHTNIGPTHIGYNVAKKMGIPHVWHIREYQDLDFNMRFFPSKQAFIRKINSKYNHSISITGDLFNHFKMKNDAMVIYDGVNSTMQFIDKKKHYFLFVGRLAETKGIRNAIEAFIELAKGNEWLDYELLIAGDGGNCFVQELHTIVDNAKLPNRIRFLGFRKDVHNLMANATALIVPSQCEGFGLITIEAIFNGCLVIGNNSGGTKEILEKEKLGILYSGHEQLVSSMKTVLSNGIQSYYPLIKRAQEIASVFYSVDRNAESIYKFYKKILKMD